MWDNMWGKVWIISLDYILNSLNEGFKVQLDIFISSTYEKSSNINELLVFLLRSRIKYYKVKYSLVFCVNQQTFLIAYNAALVNNEV